MSDNESFKASSIGGSGSIRNFIPHRVFINHVDSYHAKQLAKLLLEEEVHNGESLDGNLSSGSGEAAEQRQSQEECEEEEEQIQEEEEEEEEDKEATLERSHSVATTTREPGNNRWKGPKKFELIATASDTYEDNFCGNVRIIESAGENKATFVSEILACGYVVCDISQNDTEVERTQWLFDEMVQHLDNKQRSCPRSFEKTEPIRSFILISSVMSWARTKPKANGEAFTEADYRKRRAHPNFKAHLDLERRVCGLTKQLPDVARKLRVLVICCGITFGEEESTLHYAFKMAWCNEARLPVIEPGNNLLPLLHVRNLAATVCGVIREWPKSSCYIVAVDARPTRQDKIIKAISKNLGTGRVMPVSKEKAPLLHAELTQRIVDLASLHLDIEPGGYLLVLKERIQWQSELSFHRNIQDIVREYRIARNLRPRRLIVLGPPASGKTIIARQLAKYYRLHYIALESLVPDTIQQLMAQIEEAKLACQENEEENEDEIEETSGSQSSLIADDLEKAELLLHEIQDALQNKNQLDDYLLSKIFRRKLSSNECKNQGYIIDGYPETIEQARLLFLPDDGLENEEDHEEEDISILNSFDEFNSILPDKVFSIVASEKFLINRISSLPEKVALSLLHDEKTIVERLQIYSERNTDDNTPLDLFEELEIYPIILDIEKNPSLSMQVSFQFFRDCIGQACDYGLNPEEEAEKKRQEDAEILAQQCLINEQLRQRETELHHESVRKMKDWTELSEQLKKEEEKRLNIEAEPLRQYLIKNVFPTITQGLVKVAKLRPDDPVDFLAEFLMRENAEAKMFEPDYNESLSSILETVRRMKQEGSLQLDFDYCESLLLHHEQVDQQQSTHSSDSRDGCISINSESCADYSKESNDESTKGYGEYECHCE
ncbi:hypothetical protein TKK_0016184 [Trichogramma kaykai]